MRKNGHLLSEKEYLILIPKSGLRLKLAIPCPDPAIEWQDKLRKNATTTTISSRYQERQSPPKKRNAVGIFCHFMLIP